MKARFLTICLVLALASACSGKPAAPEPFFDGKPASEHRWSAELTLKNESIPLTLILIQPVEVDDQSRLLVLSAFGASLGDCRLRALEKPVCRSAAGAGPVMDKAAKALNNILNLNPQLLLNDNVRAAVEAKDWKALKSPDGSIHYLQGLAWSLNLNRIKP